MSRATFLQLTDFERLEEWCAKVRIVLHAVPYLVGSAQDRPDFRDVDIRVLMADERFDAMFDLVWGDQSPSGRVDDRRIRWFNRAFATWGQRETGLPIDFQVQRMTEANSEFGGPRNAMGTRDWHRPPDPAEPLAPEAALGEQVKPHE